MLIHVEVICMTGSAIRLIGWMRPDQGFHIARMAVIAFERSPVITRIAGSGMDIVGRLPGVDAMALVTIQRRHEMTAVFPLCHYPIVTAGARPRNQIVIKVCRYPGVAGVAIVAFTTRGDMIGVFSGSAYAIVTTGTRLHDIAVVKLGGRPGPGVVAGIAFFACH